MTFCDDYNVDDDDSGLCVQGLLKYTKNCFIKKRSNCQPNSVIIRDHIKGYSENKPFDDVAMLLWELERKGYRKTKNVGTHVSPEKSA